MTSHTPLDTDNWQYVDNYFKNPGDYSYAEFNLQMQQNSD